MAKDKQQNTEPVVSQLIKSREEDSQLINDRLVQQALYYAWNSKDVKRLIADHLVAEGKHSI